MFIYNLRGGLEQSATSRLNLLEVTGDNFKEILHMKINFWKAEKAKVKDPSFNPKTVGIWLATVAATMAATWLLAPAKEKKAEPVATTEPKKEKVEEPKEEKKE